jgi:hypothetical protein
MIPSFLKNNRFTLFFTIATLVFAGVSFYWDLSHKNEVFWFQRSGALLVLAGANLQFAKLAELWKRALEAETKVPTVEEKIASGHGISMAATARESSATRDFAIRIHKMVTEKSRKDVLAVIFIVAGTVIWGYGDLPFKC